MFHSPDDMDQTVFPHPVVETGGAAGLNAINRPGVELALWDRTPDPRVERFVDSLTPDQFPHARLLVPAAEARAALAPLFRDDAGETSAGAQALIADIALLCETFGALSGSPLVDIRIEHIRHDACWRFHRDCVPVRLICTYRGPGTEIVPLDRSDEALRDQRDYKGPLMPLPPYGVAVFKGSRSTASGVVHRSPPIAGQDVSRLMVCLNIPSEVSPQPIIDPHQRVGARG